MKRQIAQWLLLFLPGFLIAQNADTMSVKGFVKQAGADIQDGIIMAIRSFPSTTKIDRTIAGIINLDSLANTSYYLYAVPNPFMGKNYLPTYFVSRVDASQATMVDVFAPISNLTINLQAMTVSESGASTLNGRFYYLDGSSDVGTDFSKKWFNNPVPPTTIPIGGNPCNTLPVLLYNSQNQIVAWTITDTQGYFQFKNLAGGTYSIKGQRYGYENMNNGNINVIAASTTESTFRLWKGAVTAMEDSQLKLEDATVYPNPFKEQFQLQFSGKVTITDASGNLYYDQEYNHGQPIQSAAWPQGVYFLKTGSSVQKLIKQ